MRGWDGRPPRERRAPERRLLALALLCAVVVATVARAALWPIRSVESMTLSRDTPAMPLADSGYRGVIRLDSRLHLRHAGPDVWLRPHDSQLLREGSPWAQSVPVSQ